MPPELELMEDISTIGKIATWPPNDLFWGVMAALFVITGIVAMIMYWRKRRKQTYKYFTNNYLDELVNNFNDNPHYAIKCFSEELRRLAIRKYNREQCASIVSDSWLIWLEKNDPKKFNWSKYGCIILECPYQPAGFSSAKVRKSDFKILVKALKRWL